MKEPKRWECTECGFISNRYRKMKLNGLGFAICFKCEGKIKESDDWLSWHKAQNDRMLNQIKENGGYFFGKKIL